MQVLQTRFFARFARRAGIRAADLRTAADRLANGLVDADIGGGLVKQRIARANAGRSGGFRTILAFRLGNLAVFVYGFAKNERDNISADDLRELFRTETSSR